MQVFSDSKRGIARQARIFVLPVVLLLAIALLVGCVEDRESAQPKAAKYGGSFNYFLGEPVSIDPAFTQEGEGLQVVKQIFDGLVDYDSKTMALKPAVASSWRSNPRADEWTFWLRQGVKFHNGREVTAADFVYAWERVAAKKTASELAHHLAPIKGFDAVQKGKKRHLGGVKAVGRYILKVKLNYPFAEFPLVLGHPVFSPVPKEELNNKRRFADKPVGNGPFAMDGPWKHQVSINLKAFKDYYQEKPYLEGVNFKIIDSQETAFLEFKGGSLHYSAIPAGQIKPTVKQYGKETIVGRPQMISTFYGFNLRKAPFKGNVKLRQALNYAVNRGAIVESIYENAYLPASGIVPSGVPDYRRPAGAYTYSPRTAKRLLRAAGYPGGKGLPALQLIFNTGRGHEGPAQIVQENLRDIGVKLELRGLEFGAFLASLQAGKMSMFAAGWQADYPSRDAFIYPLFYSKSGENMVGFASAKVDRLLLSGRQALDEKRRRRFYEEAESEVLRQAPVIPLTYVGTSAIHAPSVKGFARTALDDTPLDRVWLEQ